MVFLPLLVLRSGTGDAQMRWVISVSVSSESWLFVLEKSYQHSPFLYQTLPDSPKENGDKLLAIDSNKYKSMLIRTYSTLWMIGGFVFIVYMGHLYIWAMVVVIQILMAKELFNLLRKAHEDRHLPGFRILNW